MSPKNIKNLLGGYATGTLTAEEQQALFAAALEDQELFDALACEQSLHDLLRDPAARAELLNALDIPANRPTGFWQWLRRPVVVGFATAAVAAMAVVVVWQGTRNARMKPAELAVIAELERPEPVPAQAPVQSTVPAPVQIQPPASQPEAAHRSKTADAPTAVIADKKVAHVMPKQPPLDQPKIEEDVAAPSMAPPAPPDSAPMPALIARKAESTAALGTTRSLSRAVNENGTLDARALFYAIPSAPAAYGFLDSGVAGTAVPPPVVAEAPRADATSGRAKAAFRLAAPLTAAAGRLGLRVSILRGANEVDLTTVLDPGDTVRLKLIANTDGFLYIAEGGHLLASGPVQRLKSFETPELHFEGTGQKQLYVMFSRRQQMVAPQSLSALAGGSLVETLAAQEHATYVVPGASDAAAQQLIVPVTLTYR